MFRVEKPSRAGSTSILESATRDSGNVTLSCTRNDRSDGIKPPPPGYNVEGSKQGCGMCVKIRVFFLCQTYHNIVAGGAGFSTN